MQVAINSMHVHIPFFWVKNCNRGIKNIAKDLLEVHTSCKLQLKLARARDLRAIPLSLKGNCFFRLYEMSFEFFARKLLILHSGQCCY